MKSPLKDKNKNKKDDNLKHKILLYQNETNYSIKLFIVEGKLQIYVKTSQSFSDDIYEYSNTYSFRQLQITNKYFSNFKDIDQISDDLEKLLKLKVIIENEKDKSLMLKIPTSTDKTSGDIIFKLMKTKKSTKVKPPDPEKLKAENINENILKGNNDNNNTALMGNINELFNRVKNLEKKEAEKDKYINKLKEDINNYQDKLNTSYNYPVYSPLMNKSDIDLSMDKNNNISQIIKHRNAEEDEDDDVEMNLETEKPESIKKKSKEKKSKIETINTDTKKKSKSKDKKKYNSDDESDSSSESRKKKKKRKKSDSSEESSEKEDLKDDKSENNIILKKEIENENEVIKEKQNKLYKSMTSGFKIIKRENLKDYIDSRIFYTREELQFVKRQISKGKKNIHPYFDLLYRATVDKDTEESIIANCEGHYPQLTLFYTKGGARFGVYVDKEKTKSFFKKVEFYKEKPGTSFLFSLNTKTAYNIEQGETATDNRNERLCFGRTYYYNTNESNWLIFTPKNNFLGENLKFGNQESSYSNVKYNDIVGSVDMYKLKDVEIFEVIIDKDEDEYINVNNKKDNKKKIIEEKDKKIEKEKILKEKINNDDTFLSEKKDDENEENEKEEDIKVEEKNNYEAKNENTINNIENDSDSD